MTTGKLLLSLHDVTPRHLARLIRAEALFRDLGVSDVTYLVVPRYHGGWAIEGDHEFETWCRRQRAFDVQWTFFKQRRSCLGLSVGPDRRSVWGGHDCELQ